MKTATNVTDLQETYATVVTFLQLLLCVKINDTYLQFSVVRSWLVTQL